MNFLRATKNLTGKDQRKEKRNTNEPYKINYAYPKYRYLLL